MDLRDWLIFLHLFSGFVVVAALVALWAVVFATRPSKSSLASEDAKRIGRIAGPLVGIGMVGVLFFGIWLAVESDAYNIWDSWIVASLVLWAIGGWSGGKSGKAFATGDGSRRREAVRFQAINTAAIVIILILMIWKPGV